MYKTCKISFTIFDKTILATIITTFCLERVSYDLRNMELYL